MQTSYFLIEVVGDEGESLWQIISPQGDYVGSAYWDETGMREIVTHLNRR